MKNLQGYKPPIHDWNFLLNLQKVGDLVHFQGPLVSLFKDANNTPYIYNWANSDKQYNRWFIFQTSIKNLEAYIKGEMSHYDVIMSCKNNSVYIVDLDNNIDYHNVTIINKQDIPKDYLPSKDFYHEDEDCSHLEEIQQFIKESLEQERAKREQKWKRYKYLSFTTSNTSKINHTQIKLSQYHQITQISI